MGERWYVLSRARDGSDDFAIGETFFSKHWVWTPWPYRQNGNPHPVSYDTLDGAKRALQLVRGDKEMWTEESRCNHRLVILRVTNRSERIAAALEKAGVPKEKAGKRLTLSARVECMASMLAALSPLPRSEER